MQENRAQLDRIMSEPFVHWVSISLVTADRFGRIMTALRRKGRPVPTNDVWIAAQAMETGAELLSADRHFEHIDGLAWTRF